MNGLELSERFYLECGKPMLAEQFSDCLPHLAVGLFGSGSECFGFDDEVSRDHDFEPGFMILLPGEDVVDRRTAFLLERAYAKLPKEFRGFARSAIAPVGGARHGVLRTAEFFRDKVGAPDGVLTVSEWLTTPEHALAEATNGKLFFDGRGEVTRIREGLARYPEDIRRKKLAGNLLLMAQAGQYNYLRCLKHGETGAAQLAIAEFVKAAMHTVFLLNDAYMPYYKWSFRAMRALPKLSLLAETMEYLLTTDNESALAETKYDMIEDAAADVIDELQEQGLTKAICGDLEKHAYSVNDGIADANLRNLHVLAAV
jgi:hypothetical protein